jgi:tyrosinase
MDDTFALLSWVHGWDAFSNHSAHENSVTNSLEAIHDQIHVDIGGTGHMGEISVAGKSIAGKQKQLI